MATKAPREPSSKSPPDTSSSPLGVGTAPVSLGSEAEGEADTLVGACEVGAAVGAEGDVGPFEEAPEAEGCGLSEGDGSLDTPQVFFELQCPDWHPV